jgi:hypothetical protein
MKKVVRVLALSTIALVLLTFGVHSAPNGMSEDEYIKFTKNWVTVANGKMEIYQKNVKTGKYRLLFNDDEGKWNTIEVKMGDTLK